MQIEVLDIGGKKFLLAIAWQGMTIDQDHNTRNGAVVDIAKDASIKADILDSGGFFCTMDPKQNYEYSTFLLHDINLTIARAVGEAVRQKSITVKSHFDKYAPF